MPGGDRDHVLERAAELDADDVPVRVHPEARRREELLRRRALRLVARRGDDRRRLALADLEREARARERREPRAGQPLGERPRT